MAIYLAFTFWLILTVFAGIGVYRMWARLGKSKWVNWALLPGTVVSQMAYIFGCLITGGEVHNAKLMPSNSGPASGEPTTQTTPGLKVVGPLVSSVMAMIACGAAVLVVHATLGDPVMSQFRSESLFSTVDLSQSLPSSWDGVWAEVEAQIRILRRMCETLPRLAWLKWQVALFVYLAVCLSVRLAPVSRPIRPTLGAAVVIAIVIALIGMVSQRFTDLIITIWPLLTYVWATLLFLLVATLVIWAVMALYQIVIGKEPSGGSLSQKPR